MIMRGVPVHKNISSYYINSVQVAQIYNSQQVAKVCKHPYQEVKAFGSTVSCAIIDLIKNKLIVVENDRMVLKFENTQNLVLTQSKIYLSKL